MDKARTVCRLTVCFLCLLFPIAAGIGLFDIPQFDIWMLRSSFWVMFVATILCGAILVWSGWLNRHRLINIIISHRVGIVVAILSSVYLLVHEPHEFKLLPHEYNIASTARSMHLYRTYAIVDAGHTSVSGSTSVKARISEVSPFYPWLLSMVHGLTGYRPGNAFVLNGVLGFLSCVIMYALVTHWIGSSFGIISVLLFVGVPVLHEVVTGGGGEVLVILLLLGLLFQIRVFLDHPCIRNCVLLITVGFLLSCSSPFGSFLSLVLLLFIGLFGVIAPSRLWLFCLLSVCWIYPVLSSDWTDRPVLTGDLLFAISRISDGVVFLFDTTRSYANSPILSVIGLVSVVLLFVHILKTRDFMPAKESRDPNLFLLIIAACFFIVLFVSKGGWTDPRYSFESLYFYLMAVLIIPYVMRFGFGILYIGKSVYLLPVVFALVSNGTWNAWGSPSRIKDPESVGMRLIDRFFRSEPSLENALYIGPGSCGAIVRKLSAMPIDYANLIPERIQLMMDLECYQHVYVGEWVAENGFLDEKDTVSPRFLLEIISEWAINDVLSFRLSRLVGVSDSVPGNETLPENLPLPFPAAGSTRMDGLVYISDLLNRPAKAANQ